MFEITNLRKDYGDRPVLDGVSFKIGINQKVGLVGANGCGKSTLLKIISGSVELDAGSLTTFGNVRFGYLAQTLDDSPAQTVGELLAPEVSSAIKKMRAFEKQMAHENNQDTFDAYSKAVEEFESAGGYETEARLSTILASLGLPDLSWSHPVTALSGGQKTRLALARILSMDADVLLLDEPTNNLDVEALEWLEKAVIAHRGCAVIVSHDRRFLDRVTTRTFELNSTNGKLTEYGGNYSWYQKRKAEDEARQWREYEEQQDRIKQLKQNIVAHKEKALVTENSTVHDFFRGRSKKVAATAKARTTRLERLLSADQKVERPRSTETMRLSLASSTIPGARLVTLTDCTIARSNKSIVEEVNLEVLGAKRIAIVGNNGSGKTSLLEALVGNLDLASGFVQRRPGLTLCYLAQNQEVLDQSETVIQYFLSQVQVDKFDEASARTFLHRFLFTRDAVFKRIEQLSRGERTKLILATFMAQQPDLLILDEPTNHLDLPTLECLETALKAYRGALIVVSHDRFFLDQIQPQLIWKIANKTVTQSYV